MNSLIIVGNGFDLAHGLKTSYLDFMKSLIDNHCKDRTFCSNVFNLPDYIDCYDAFMTEFGQKKRNIYGEEEEIPGIKIRLARILLDDFKLNNWCDIESRYFELLKVIGSKESYNYNNAKDLNEEFALLKNYLQNYLDTQQSLGTSIVAYADMFNRLCNSDTLVLNFNYTDTIERLYSREIPSSNILHIHGELNSHENPIIFGFAANNEDIKLLIDKNDNEFLRNIKRHEYKRTNNEKRLAEYLKNTENIRILILGHSCGISDKLILEQVLNHKNIHSVRILYYDTYESYFNSHINIYRIIRNNDNYEKIINFQDCCRMPQIIDMEDDHDYIFDFAEKIHHEYSEGIKFLPENKVASF